MDEVELLRDGGGLGTVGVVAGMRVSALVRAGVFPSVDVADRRQDEGMRVGHHGRRQDAAGRAGHDEAQACAPGGAGAGGGCARKRVDWRTGAVHAEPSAYQCAHTPPLPLIHCQR